MKSRFLTLNCTGIFVSLLFLHSALSHAADPVARRIIVFGDSLTAGSVLPEANRDSSWIRLAQKRAAGKLILVNEGKGGRSTDSEGEFKLMLTRNMHADLLVLALGTNDSRNVEGKCVENAVKNLRDMITLAREFYGQDLAVLLVGPPNIRKEALGPSKSIGEQREANLKALNTAYEKLAAELKCDFVSLYGVVPEESLEKDGVHPDAAGKSSVGNEAIARTVLPKLLPGQP